MSFSPTPSFPLPLSPSLSFLSLSHTHFLPPSLSFQEVLPDLPLDLVLYFYGINIISSSQDSIFPRPLHISFPPTTIKHFQGFFDKILAHSSLFSRLKGTLTQPWSSYVYDYVLRTLESEPVTNCVIFNNNEKLPKDD